MSGGRKNFTQSYRNSNGKGNSYRGNRSNGQQDYRPNQTRNRSPNRFSSFKEPQKEQPAPITQSDNQLPQVAQTLALRATMETASYGISSELYDPMSFDAYEDHFPETAGKQRVRFDLGGREYEFNVHAIKVFIRNVFNSHPETLTENIVKTYELIHSLFTRKFGRELDYMIPEIDEERIEAIKRARPHKDCDDFFTSKQSEMFLKFSQQNQETTPIGNFYVAYRAIIPNADFSDVEIDVQQFVKLYNNLVYAEMKNNYGPKGGQRQSQEEKDKFRAATEDARCVIKIIRLAFELTHKSNLPHMLAKAIVLNRISGIWSFLTNSFNFITPEDRDFFNDECDFIEPYEYEELIKKMSALSLNSQIENALNKMLIAILRNILNYKLQRITTINYDSNYRKIVLGFITSEFKSLFGEFARTHEIRKVGFVPRKGVWDGRNYEQEELGKNQLINKAFLECVSKPITFSKNFTTERVFSIVSKEEFIQLIKDKFECEETFGDQFFGFLLANYRTRSEWNLVNSMLQSFKYINDKRQYKAKLMANLFGLTIMSQDDSYLNSFRIISREYGRLNNVSEFAIIGEVSNVLKNRYFIKDLKKIYELSARPAILSYIDEAIKHFSQPNKPADFTSFRLFGLEDLKELLVKNI